MLSILRFDPIIIVIFFGMCAFDPYFVYLKMCTKTLCITCYNRRQFFSSLWPFIRIWFIDKLSPLLSHFVNFFAFVKLFIVDQLIVDERSMVIQMQTKNLYKYFQQVCLNVHLSYFGIWEKICFLIGRKNRFNGGGSCWIRCIYLSLALRRYQSFH